MSEALTVHPPQVQTVSTEVMDQYMAQAQLTFKSGLIPTKKFTNPEQMVVAALYGRELGISFQRSMREIHVVNGIPGVSANLMLSLIRERMKQARIVLKESTAQRCEIMAAREAEDPLVSFAFTIQEAAQAGLTSKDVWKGYAQDMLFARTVTRMGRRMFSDVLLGFVYTPEELEGSPEPGGGMAAAVAGPGRMPKRGPVQVEQVQEEVRQAAGRPAWDQSVPDPARETLRQASEQVPAVEGKAKDFQPPKPVVVDALAAQPPVPAQEGLFQDMGMADPRATAALKVRLDAAPDVRAVEFEYDRWRSAYQGHTLTLADGFEIYSQRLENLKR